MPTQPLLSFSNPISSWKNRRQRWRKCEFPSQRSTVWQMCGVWSRAGWCRWPQRSHSAAHNTVTATGHAQWGAQCPAHSWLLSPTTHSLSMIDRDGEVKGEERTSAHTENKACEYKHLVMMRAKSYNWGYAACDFAQNLLSKVNQWPSCERKLLG